MLLRSLNSLSVIRTHKSLLKLEVSQVNSVDKAYLSVFNRKTSCIFPNRKKETTFQQIRRLSNTLHLDPVVQPQMYTGIFKSLSESESVQFLQSSLVEIHLLTGLPWWGTIICSTILMRSLTTLPLSIYQKNIIAKLELLKYEMNDLVKELKKETSIAVKMFKWDEKTSRRAYNASLKKQWNQLIIRDNCHPLKTTVVMWVQIPLWISISMSLRNLVYMLPKHDHVAELSYAQLSTEGIGWISNLTEADPFFVLPITFGIVNLALIELTTMSKVTELTKFQKIVTNLFRGFTIILVPICASIPSGIVLYWTTSSIFGLVQNILLMSPKVRRFCKIPGTPSEIQNPYEHLLITIRNRFSFLCKTK